MKVKGRPRIHATATDKQREYRHRKTARLRAESVPGLAERLHGVLASAAAAGSSEAARLAGASVEETLDRLRTDAETRFGAASN